LLPVAVAVVIASRAGFPIAAFDEAILWSLVCEEIYYTIYPLLLRARARWGLPLLIAVSALAGVGVALTAPHAGNYPSFGPALNWVLGLPCWLLGCLLAERWDGVRGVPPSAGRLWGFRALAFGASIAASALRFHSPIGYPWTLNVFALLVYFWLREE